MKSKSIKTIIIQAFDSFVLNETYNGILKDYRPTSIEDFEKEIKHNLQHDSIYNEFDECDGNKYYVVISIYPDKSFTYKITHFPKVSDIIVYAWVDKIEVCSKKGCGDDSPLRVQICGGAV